MKEKNKNVPLRAHLSMFMAEVFWGLMAPMTKDAMLSGVDGFSIVTLRVLGACALFWLASLFLPREKVPRHDILLFAGAAVLGIATNQCLFTIGINYTSPIDASIVTTTMPIFAMVFSFLILKEPITWKKASGVAVGFVGALMLILSSVTSSSAKVGGLTGDLMCLGAQFSFALYLSLFNPLVRRYNVVTVNKWMFLFASIYICPFTMGHTLSVEWSAVPVRALFDVAFIVVIGTFVCYFLSIVSQRVLRPTVVSIYNYVQPIVSVVVSVLTGMGVFTFLQGLAIILVFLGVWLVTKSKSKRDLAA